MNSKNEVFDQDLEETQRPGAVFMIQLLMKKSVALPDKEYMMNVMKKHLQFASGGREYK